MNWERVLIKGKLIFILIILMMVGFEASDSGADEARKTKWGFSVLLGPSARGHVDFTHSALLPQGGLAIHKKWDLEFEGNFSHYFIDGEKDLYLLGVNANLLFKPIQWGKVTPFAIAGAGLAYNNNSGFVREIGDSHTAGVLQGGGGVFYDLGRGLQLRCEYRYHHISDPFERDYGLNTHSFILGVTF